MKQLLSISVFDFGQRGKYFPGTFLLKYFRNNFNLKKKHKKILIGKYILLAFDVLNAYSITISCTSIYPGTTKILLTITATIPWYYQHHYHWARSGLLYQPDNSDLLINVSNRTQSTRLQSCELSTPLPLGAISFALSTRQYRSSQSSR